jgi:predicted AlkP superfamily phosphohydrolase/phosphomutase
MTPFVAGLGRPSVMFDPPYFNLATAPDALGLVGWGAHDPGVAQSSRPEGLADEIERRFGPYPATPWIYGFVWPSPERTRTMGEDLVRAIDLRADIASWMFGDRLPDWELGYMVVSEYHSAIEALWHGVDPDHPLNALPSAEPARLGLEAVYEAGDRLVGRMIDRFPDARFAIFNPHGMGANNADVANMLLLPELLYRHSFGRPCNRGGDWPTLADGTPVIAGEQSWEDEIDRTLPNTLKRQGRVGRAASRLRRIVGGDDAEEGLPLDWMPSVRYRRFWPEMRAFAFPSFYDGQVRINLAGREARGIVARDDYESTCDEIETLLRECRDLATGRPVVSAIERTARPDRLDGSEPDLLFLWAGSPLGLDHPVHGRIGPFPYRRSGGHTGGDGIAWLAGPGIVAGDHGTRSAFDIVPTVIDLLGDRPAGKLSGESFRREIERAAVAA